MILVRRRPLLMIGAVLVAVLLGYGFASLDAAHRPAIIALLALIIILVFRDVTRRKHDEETARFLAEASDVLASSLDYKMTLASIARLAVPHLADWCAVHVKMDNGAIQQLALAHADPSKVELAQELQRRYLDDPNAPYSVPNVIQKGKPELLARITANQFPVASRAREPLKILPDLRLKSLMVVPLIVPAETFGAITFVSAESGRHYGQADLALAQDLARRAALAVENARLYHRAQSLNEELDQRTARRTSEIQTANAKLETEIVEHRRSAEQLRLLAAHLQSVLEEERVRVAREIHDQIGQIMTAVKMDLVLLERNLTRNGSKESPEKLRAEISSTTKLVDDAISMMHEIVRELRPAELDHLGLRGAIEWQMQDFQDRTKIECQFDSDLDELEIDPTRSTAVFRIVQQALTNVARHAHATHVEASLRKEDEQVIFQLRDNGKGISEAQISNVKTFGLLGMRERAQVFGGDVVVLGTPEQGTVVTVRIPAKPLSEEGKDQGHHDD